MEEIIGVVPFQPGRGAHEHSVLLSPLPQTGGHPAALVIFNELAGELLLHPLALFTAGQQQIALHLHQVGGHLDKGAGNFRVGALGRFHRAGVLVDELQNGDVVQVHLVLLHQREQQLQRALKILQTEGQFFCHSDHRPEGCIIRRIGDLVDVAPPAGCGCRPTAGWE